MATKEERKHMDKVAQLGCYVCKSPATLHHIRNNGKGNVGMGRRSSHFEVIPLCYEHHQGNTDVMGGPDFLSRRSHAIATLLDSKLDINNPWQFSIHSALFGFMSCTQFSKEPVQIGTLNNT